MRGGRKFALKIVRKEQISSEEEQALGEELALLRRLRHPTLLQLVDELDTPAEWYFIMELFAVCLSLFLSPRLCLSPSVILSLSMSLSVKL